MKSILVCVLVSALFPLRSITADEPLVRLALPDVPVILVLEQYEHLAKHKVWIALGVNGSAGSVTVETPQPVSSADAMQLIQTTLLERCGIELKDSGGQTFVDWSSDPKYPHSKAFQGIPVRVRLPQPTPH
jgi:hypothetical protein